MDELHIIDRILLVVVCKVKKNDSDCYFGESMIVIASYIFKYPVCLTLNRKNKCDWAWPY